MRPKAPEERHVYRTEQPTNPKLRRSGMKALTTRLSANKGACRPAGAWKYPVDVARYKHVAPLALTFNVQSAISGSVTGQGRVLRIPLRRRPVTKERTFQPHPIEPRS